MSTGRVHAGFFPKQILGSEILRDNLFEAGRDYARDLGGRVIGEAVIDATLNGLGITDDAAAINERKLTITGTNIPALADNGDVFNAMGSTSTLSQLVEGSRTITLNDPAWFTALPYENADATTYFVYLTMIAFPIDVNVGTTSDRGYGRFVEAPGIIINPATVADGGAGLEFTVLGGMTALGIQPWLTANAQDNDWSYDCVIWLDTDVVGVEIENDDPDVSIAFAAKLTKRTGNPDWFIDITGIGDGYLGQTSFDTDVTHYKIAVLGPIITTTDFDTNEDYVHVGQVDSAVGSETINTSSQIIIDDISTQLTQSVVVNGRYHKRGWYTAPTSSFSVVDTQLDIAVGGEIAHGGRAISVAAQSLNAFPINSTLYVYYDNTTGVETFAFTAVADDAMLNANRIPYMVFDTDGASAAITATAIVLGQRILKFTDVLTLTVATDANQNAMFRTLDQALSYAYHMKLTSESLRRVIIDVIGDVSVASSLDSTSWGTLTNVTIRGSAQGGVNGSLTAGSRITWSFNAAALFDIDADMKGWTFENLVFQYSGGLGAQIESVMSKNGGDITNVRFTQCVFDGNAAAVAIGGANGNLTHVVFDNNAAATNAITGLVFDRCSFYTDGPAVYTGTLQTSDPSQLEFLECTANQTGVTAVFGGGFLSMNHATLAASVVRVKGCKFTELNGPLIDCEGVVDLLVSSNRVHVVPGAGAGNFINISDSADYGNSNVSGVKIHDNYFSMTGAAGFNRGISIHTDSTSGKADINIHNNYLSMDASPGTSTGIVINSGTLVSTNDGASGVKIHDNTLVNITSLGIGVQECDMTIVHSNSVSMSVTAGAGIRVEGHGGITDPSIITHSNIVKQSGTGGATAFGLDYSANIESGQGHICAHNIVDQIDLVSTTHTGFALRDSGGVELSGVFSGNISAGAAIGFDMDLENSVVMGNRVVAMVGSAFAFQGEDIQRTVFLGNTVDTTVVEAVTLVTAGTDWNDIAIVGNMFRSTSPNMLNLGDATVVGNVLYDLDIGGVRTVVVGNRLQAVDVDSTALPAAVDFAWSGNDLFTWTDTSSVTSYAFAGNHVRGGPTFNGNSATISGNHFSSAPTLSATTSNICAIANEIGGGGVWSDLGAASNLVVTATNSDPLNS